MATSRRAINLGELVVPGIALLFVAAFFWQTYAGPRKALYWPIIVAVAFSVFWVLVLAKFLFLSPTGDVSPAPKQSAAGPVSRYGRGLLIGGGSVVYVILVPYLGFTVSSFLFMLAVFRGLGSRKWVTNILVGLGIAAFLHVALIVLMKMSLPQLHLGPIVL